MAWHDFKDLLANPHYLVPYTLWFTAIFIISSWLFINPQIINTPWFFAITIFGFLLFVLVDSIAAGVIHKDLFKKKSRMAFLGFLVSKIIRNLFLWIPVAYLIYYFMNFIYFLILSYADMLDQGISASAFINQNLYNLMVSPLPIMVLVFLLVYFYLNTFLFHWELFLKRKSFLVSTFNTFRFIKGKSSLFYKNGFVLTLLDLSCLLLFVLAGNLIPNFYLGLALALLYFIFIFSLKKLFVLKRLGEANVFR